MRALRAARKFRSTPQRPELRCAMLCCAVLCCAVLCCAVLCCAVLCCALPDYKFGIPYREPRMQRWAGTSKVGVGSKQGSTAIPRFTSFAPVPPRAPQVPVFAANLRREVEAVRVRMNAKLQRELRNLQSMIQLVSGETGASYGGDHVRSYRTTVLYGYL